MGEHQAWGAQRECEPAVSRLGSSSLAGGKTQEFALTPPEKMGKTDGANPSVTSLDIWVCNVPFLAIPVFGLLGL